MKALVVGAAGQLGEALTRMLDGTDEVVATTRTELDIVDAAAVLETVTATRPDVILNCAAYNDVDGAESDPRTALAVNAFGVQSLAAAASAVDATLVHYSTDFVFDGEAVRPYCETDPPNPQSVYATSKLLGEWFAADAPRHYVLRVESLFGGGGLARDPDGRARGSSLDRLADGMLQSREVQVFVDRTVSPSYIEDVCDATVALLRIQPPDGLYHCVGSGHATWFGVATELAQRLGVTPVIRGIRLDDLDLPARRPKFCALSNQKLADVGAAMPTWQDALARYAERRRQTARTS